MLTRLPFRLRLYFSWAITKIVILSVVLPLVFNLSQAFAQESIKPWVATIDMKMLILPGTAAFLDDAISQAEAQGASMVIVKLDTPGGVLQTTQEMIQSIFKSRVPVAVYVSPTGGTATSAGVFITMAAHIAAMSPGTTIGAAHPVSSEGKDIEGDMRAKAENAAISLVKAISAERGRNIEWATKAVKESSSLTEREAVEQKVVDFIAQDITELLKFSSHRKVRLAGGDFEIGDLSQAEVREIPMAVRHQAVNFLAHPNIAAILWLLATTGISIELYNPGLILPGVVGVIALILALAVGQVIPINFGAVALLALGAVLIGADLFIGSMALAVCGVIAMALGALYIVDAQQAPGLVVSLRLILPIALTMGGIMLLFVFTIARGYRGKSTINRESSLEGQKGRALEDITAEGRVSVGGTVWQATLVGSPVKKNQEIVVKRSLGGLKIEVQGIS